MLRSVISKISPSRRVAALSSACGLAIVGTLALLGTAGAASISCSNVTLNGTYAFAAIGWSISAGKAEPLSLAGFDTFNGKGTSTGVITVVVNGVVVNNNTPDTSTYTINADCTGTIVFNTAGSLAHYNIYVSPSGGEMRLIETDPGSVATEIETRVSNQNQ
jgi:hypothetical protein